MNRIPHTNQDTTPTVVDNYITYDLITGAISQICTWSSVPPEGFGEIPYGSIQNLMQFIQQHCVNPSTGQVQIRPDLDQIQQLQRQQSVRNMRNYLLTQSDWTQVTDNNLTQEQRTAWQTYRQALRDITDTLPDPIPEGYQPAWPEKPV
jgi:hypothetical protein